MAIMSSMAAHIETSCVKGFRPVFFVGRDAAFCAPVTAGKT